MRSCKIINFVWWTSLIFAAVVGVRVSAISFEPEIESSIDDLIKNAFLPQNHVVGLGLAVLKHNSSMTRGFGFQDLENEVLATPSTLFAVASVSKSFTATLVIKILSEAFPQHGENVLDMPIRELIPTQNFTLIDRFRSEKVSFRDLLSHRLCLELATVGIASGVYADKNEFLYRQRYAREVCSFRSSFVYNNAGFAIASELVAGLTGIPLEDLLTEFLDDLGMTESTYVQPSVDYDAKVNMAKPYYRNGTQTLKYHPELLKRVSVYIGAGGILTTPNDMLKYMDFYLKDGKVGDRQIISKEVMGWLKRMGNSVHFTGWRRSESDASLGDFGYGLGYFLGMHDGWERVSHAGYRPPYLSFLAFYPELKLGIFTTMNGPGLLLPPSDLESLTAQIFDIVMAGEAGNLQGVQNLKIRPNFAAELCQYQNQLDLKRQRVSSPAVNGHETVGKNRIQIAGSYGNGLSGELTLTALNGSREGEFYMRYGRWGTGLVIPTSNSDLYELRYDSEIVQDDWALPIPLPPPVLLDFSEPNQFVYIGADGGRIIFEKDLTLDKLPAQPWDPESCSAQ